MIDKEMDILMNAWVLFGLKQQGHLLKIGWYIEYKKEHLKVNLHFVEGEGWCI